MQLIAIISLFILSLSVIAEDDSYGIGRPSIGKEYSISSSFAAQSGMNEQTEDQAIKVTTLIEDTENFVNQVDDIIELSEQNPDLTEALRDLRRGATNFGRALLERTRSNPYFQVYSSALSIHPLTERAREIHEKLLTSLDEFAQSKEGEELSEAVKDASAGLKKVASALWKAQYNPHVQATAAAATESANKLVEKFYEKTQKYYFDAAESTENLVVKGCEKADEYYFKAIEDAQAFYNEKSQELVPQMQFLQEASKFFAARSLEQARRYYEEGAELVAERLVPYGRISNEESDGRINHFMNLYNQASLQKENNDTEEEIVTAVQEEKEIEAKVPSQQSSSWKKFVPGKRAAQAALYAPKKVWGLVTYMTPKTLKKE